MGDKRTYEQVIALRAVQSEDFMTADWYVVLYSLLPATRIDLLVFDRYVFPPEVLRKVSSRITNEVPGINRVTYDISSKPPSVSTHDLLSFSNVLLMICLTDRGVVIKSECVCEKEAVVVYHSNVIQ